MITKMIKADVMKLLVLILAVLTPLLICNPPMFESLYNLYDTLFFQINQNENRMIPSIKREGVMQV